MNIKEIKEKNKSYKKEQVNFTLYCLSKMEDREINKETVLNYLLGNGLLKVELQKITHRGEIEKRYKLVYKLSSKYFLIVIVSYEESILNVINVIKTSKNLEKKWRKRISK